MSFPYAFSTLHSILHSLLQNLHLGLLIHSRLWFWCNLVTFFAVAWTCPQTSAGAAHCGKSSTSQLLRPSPMQIPIASSLTATPPTPLPSKTEHEWNQFPRVPRAKQVTEHFPTISESIKITSLVQSAQGIAPGQGQMGSSSPHSPQQQHMGQQGGPSCCPHLFGVMHDLHGAFNASAPTSSLISTSSLSRRAGITTLLCINDKDEAELATVEAVDWTWVYDFFKANLIVNGRSGKKGMRVGPMLGILVMKPWYLPHRLLFLNNKCKAGSTVQTYSPSLVCNWGIFQGLI